MTQDLGHLRERRARPQHLGPRRVTKAVRAEASEPGPLAGCPDHLADSLGGQPAKRGGCTQEHLSLGTPGPAMAQVAGDRLAHVAGQGQALLGVALAAHHDFPGPPVDVVEAQRGDLGGPQPEAGQQYQDGVITLARRPAAVTARQQRRDLPGRQAPRQPGAAPSRH